MIIFKQIDTQSSDIQFLGVLKLSLVIAWPVAWPITQGDLAPCVTGAAEVLRQQTWFYFPGRARPRDIWSGVPQGSVLISLLIILVLLLHLLILIQIIYHFISLNNTFPVFIYQSFWPLSFIFIFSTYWTICKMLW